MNTYGFDLSYALFGGSLSFTILNNQWLLSVSFKHDQSEMKCMFSCAGFELMPQQIQQLHKKKVVKLTSYLNTISSNVQFSKWNLILKLTNAASKLPRYAFLLIFKIQHNMNTVYWSILFCCVGNHFTEGSLMEEEINIERILQYCL